MKSAMFIYTLKKKNLILLKLKDRLILLQVTSIPNLNQKMQVFLNCVGDTDIEDDWQIQNNLIKFPIEETEARRIKEQQNQIEFDQIIIGQRATQVGIFESTVKPSITQFVQGQSLNFFNYGLKQTGQTSFFFGSQLKSVNSENQQKASLSKQLNEMTKRFCNRKIEPFQMVETNPHQTSKQKYVNQSQNQNSVSKYNLGLVIQSYNQIARLIQIQGKQNHSRFCQFILACSFAQVRDVEVIDLLDDHCGSNIQNGVHMDHQNYNSLYKIENIKKYHLTSSEQLNTQLIQGFTNHGKINQTIKDSRSHMIFSFHLTRVDLVQQQENSKHHINANISVNDYCSESSNIDRNPNTKNDHQNQELLDFFKEVNISFQEQINRKNHFQRQQTYSITKSVVNFFDLANCQKLLLTDQTQQHQQIDRNLLIFKEVVSLQSKGCAQQQIPYEKSLLTQIWRNSLAMEAENSIFLFCQLLKSNHENVLSVLRFGEKAKKVKMVEYSSNNNPIICPRREQCGISQNIQYKNQTRINNSHEINNNGPQEMSDSDQKPSTLSPNTKVNKILTPIQTNQKNQLNTENKDEGTIEKTSMAILNDLDLVPLLVEDYEKLIQSLKAEIQFLVEKQSKSSLPQKEMECKCGGENYKDALLNCQTQTEDRQHYFGQLIELKRQMDILYNEKNQVRMEKNEVYNLFSIVKENLMIVEDVQSELNKQIQMLDILLAEHVKTRQDRIDFRPEQLMEDKQNYMKITENSLITGNSSINLSLFNKTKELTLPLNQKIQLFRISVSGLNAIMQNSQDYLTNELATLEPLQTNQFDTHSSRFSQILREKLNNECRNQYQRDNYLNSGRFSSFQNIDQTFIQQVSIDDEYYYQNGGTIENELRAQECQNLSDEYFDHLFDGVQTGFIRKGGSNTERQSTGYSCFRFNNESQNNSSESESSSKIKTDRRSREKRSIDKHQIN